MREGVGGGGGEVDRDLNKLAKLAFRSQCTHKEHSEGPMDTVLSSSKTKIIACIARCKSFLKIFNFTPPILI